MFFLPCPVVNLLCVHEKLPDGVSPEQLSYVVWTFTPLKPHVFPPPLFPPPKVELILLERAPLGAPEAGAGGLVFPTPASLIRISLLSSRLCCVQIQSLGSRNSPSNSKDGVNGAVDDPETDKAGPSLSGPVTQSDCMITTGTPAK